MSFGAGAGQQGQHGRRLSATGLTIRHLWLLRPPVPSRADAAEIPSAGCRCVSAGSRDKTAPVSYFLCSWKSPKRKEVITNSAGKMLVSAGCWRWEEGCSAQWVPTGLQPRSTGADSGMGWWAARGWQRPAGHSMVPPNRCCSGPVAIAMLMSQRRQEALQCRSWHLSSRQAEAILGFSWVKSQGAARAADFPSTGAPGSHVPSPSPFAPTVVASPCPAQGEGSQPAAGSPGKVLSGTRVRWSRFHCRLHERR